MSTTQLTIARESQEKLEVPMTCSVDPTSLEIEFSFPVLGQRPSTWTTGTWLNGRATGGGRRWEATAVSPLIGATGGAVDTVQLGTGTYSVFVRITDSIEIPVVNCGQVRIA